MTFLKNLAAADTAVVTLKHPVTGEDLLDSSKNPVTVEVYGKASDVHQDYMNSVLKKAIEKQKVANKIKQQDITPEKIKSDEIDFLVAMTKCFNDDGKSLTDKEEIRNIYSDKKYYFIKEQVNAALENDSNFFKP